MPACPRLEWLAVPVPRWVSAVPRRFDRYASTRSLAVANPMRNSEESPSPRAEGVVYGLHVVAVRVS